MKGKMKQITIDAAKKTHNQQLNIEIGLTLVFFILRWHRMRAKSDVVSWPHFYRRLSNVLSRAQKTDSITH